MRYFLVIILLTGDFEQHVTIEQPDMETCEWLLEQNKHAVAYRGDERTDTVIDEVRCEEIEDE